MFFSNSIFSDLIPADFMILKSDETLSPSDLIDLSFFSYRYTTFLGNETS